MYVVDVYMRQKESIETRKTLKTQLTKFLGSGDVYSF